MQASLCSRKLGQVGRREDQFFLPERLAYYIILEQSTRRATGFLLRPVDPRGGLTLVTHSGVHTFAQASRTIVKPATTGQFSRLPDRDGRLTAVANAYDDVRG